MALRTGSSLKSNNMGRSFLRISTIFSEWSLNFLTTFFSSVITLSLSTRNVLLSVRVLSVKFSLIVCQIFDHLQKDRQVLHQETTSGTTSDNKWQQMTTSGTTNDKEWYNEWQRVVQRVAANDNEWQRMTTSNKRGQ